MVGLDLLPEDIFAVFGRIGFSRYEAKAYATLCSCGRLKMGALAKYSTVPQSKIYSVVETLEEKGAVLVSRAWRSTAESGKGLTLVLFFLTIGYTDATGARIPPHFLTNQSTPRTTDSDGSVDLRKHYGLWKRSGFETSHEKVSARQTHAALDPLYPVPR